jgi:hypothetical protein
MQGEQEEGSVGMDERKMFDDSPDYPDSEFQFK